MAKFCSKCGNELREGNKFCDKCGMPVQSEQNAVSNHVEVLQTRKNEKGILYMAVVVVLVILAVFGMRACVNKGYEKPFQYLEKGINNCDADAFLKAFHPSVYEDYAPSDEDLINVFGEDRMTIHFEILDAEKLTTEQLSDYKEKYGKVKEGYQVKVEVFVKGQESVYSELSGNKKTYSEVLEVDVIKIGGKWYFAHEYL